MKIEIEILDSDLKDREAILKMKDLLMAELKNLSDYSKNALVHTIQRMQSSIEELETGWLRNQNERMRNQFCDTLNVDRAKLTNIDYWRDD